MENTQSNYHFNNGFYSKLIYLSPFGESYVPSSETQELARKPKIKGKPSLESFKDNWGPCEYLAKIFTMKGLKSKAESADRSQGLTGMIQIDHNNPKKQDIINSLNNQELIKGYKVKLSQRQVPNIVYFEFEEIRR